MKLLATLTLLLLPLAGLAGDEYGKADFSRNDAWPRAGLRGFWPRMDPGVMGDATGGVGDFEEWTGTEGGCTDCPAGITCSCTGTSDINPDTTYIYKSNTSVKFEVDAGNSAVYKYYTFTYKANKCYQASWCDKGDVGGEDYYVTLQNTAGNDYYVSTTDSWQVGASTLNFANIPTSWTCRNMFIRTGVADKIDYQFWIVRNGASQTYYFDNFQIRELHSCDVTGSLENSLTIPTDADPVFGKAEILLPTTGGAPAGSYGMELDNLDDYLPGGDILSPVDGSLTVACWTIPRTVVGTHTPISQWHSVVNQCSYLLNFDTDDVKWYVDDDGTGGSSTMIEDSDVLVAGTQQRFVATYKQVASGSSEMTLQLNHEAEVVSNVAVAPIHDSTGDFCIGGAHGGANIFDGFIGKCGVWHTALDAVQRSKVLSPYFPGNSHGDGFYVTTCDQANPHATCSAQKCRKGTPHGCQADATGTMPIFTDRDELVADNYFGTFTGGDSNPDWTEWTKIVDPGDGTTNITAYRADTMYGDVAGRLTTTGTTSYAILSSRGCLTVSPSTDYYAHAKAKNFSGSKQLLNKGLSMIARVYTDGGCTIGLSTITVVSSRDVSTNWEEIGDVFTTNADTNSMKLWLQNYHTTMDVLVDAVSVKEATHRTPFCPCPSGAAPCTCDARDYRLHNPLSDYVESEGKYGYEDGFCASACIYSDWAGDDGVYHYILNIPGTAGSNNRLTLYKDAGNNIWVGIYDAVGDVRSVLLALTGTNWTAGGRKFVEMCSNNTDDTVKGRWYNVSNSTWYTLAGLGGAGTGIQDGQSDELHVGHNANNFHLDGYFTGEAVTIVPYNDIYPQAGFEACKNFKRRPY